MDFFLLALDGVSFSFSFFFWKYGDVNKLDETNRFRLFTFCVKCVGDEPFSFDVRQSEHRYNQICLCWAHVGWLTFLLLQLETVFFFGASFVWVYVLW